ncbi:MAG: hypothetical protein AAGE99_04525, partial [Chlamydiota bacterium]
GIKSLAGLENCKGIVFPGSDLVFREIGLQISARKESNGDLSGKNKLCSKPIRIRKGCRDLKRLVLKTL